MKCPKCGYLGFESGDRCRNCGYDFSLAPATPAWDLSLEPEVEQSGPQIDLDRIIGGPEPPTPAADLPLFGRQVDDAPLITAPSRPRAPLGVRRPTPEVPRARTRAVRSAASDDTLFEHSSPSTDASAGSAGHPRLDLLAGSSSRIMAALVDASILSALDAVVLALTLRLCGLTTAEIVQLPMLPLAAFFLLLNGGYFVAFTAVGGQSIGKMALGIRVVTQEDGSVPIGRATIRTLAYLVSALPLGAGFLPGVLSPGRLALHDRLAHTRVVRPFST